MFRQKLAEVANVTCRLIPNDKNDFSMFRAPVHGEKSVLKDLKEKYSLKTQAISSGKTDPKNISAKKTLSKFSKISEDDRISITANMHSQKKTFDRSKISSPETYVPKIFDETVTPSGSLPKAQNNFSQVVYVFKTKQENRPKEELNTQGDVSNKKTFGALKKFTIAHQNAKTVLASYTSSEKNKQNALKAGNLVSEDKLLQKTDKSLKKVREIVENRIPFSEVNLHINNQFTHGSLEKYEKSKDQAGQFNSIVTGGHQTNRFFQLKKNQAHQGNFYHHKSPQQSNSQSNSKIMRFEEKGAITERDVPKTQYCQSEEFKNFLKNVRSNSVQKITENSVLTNKSSERNGLSNHKRVHTFNDLMGQKKLSQSILSDQEDNESDSSVVIMTFKDLVEKNKAEKERFGENSEDDINKLSFIKNLSHFEAQKASTLTNESDFLTKLKPYGGFKAHITQL